MTSVSKTTSGRLVALLNKNGESLLVLFGPIGCATVICARTGSASAGAAPGATVAPLVTSP